MAYPPNAQALIGRAHEQEHVEVLAAMAAAAFANSGLSEKEIAKGSVSLALEIRKQVEAQLK
ncbi:hypothetical protein LPB41_03355 [Thalassospira sp. MA62]|nr:hypothetical protein [Thalassospira sp. MA62]